MGEHEETTPEREGIVDQQGATLEAMQDAELDEELDEELEQVQENQETG